MTFSEFWPAALSFYRQDSWQQTLLHWQDNHQANVNLALLCLVLDQKQQQLTPEQINQLHNSVSEFSKDNTQVIRATRRQIKANAEQINDYQAIRGHLLDAELLLEQQEQQLLLTELEGFSVPDSLTKADNDSDITNDSNNWQRYQEFLTG